MIVIPLIGNLDCLIKKKQIPFYCLFLLFIKLMSLLSGNWKTFPLRILDFVTSYTKLQSARGNTHYNSKIISTIFLLIFISAPSVDFRCIRNISKNKETNSSRSSDICCLLLQVGLFNFKCYKNQWNKMIAVIFKISLKLLEINRMLWIQKKDFVTRYDDCKKWWKNPKHYS